MFMILALWGDDGCQPRITAWGGLTCGVRPNLRGAATWSSFGHAHLGLLGNTASSAASRLLGATSARSCTGTARVACNWLSTAKRQSYTAGPRRLGEEGEAVQYHMEAYRVDPTNLDTISWLGAHHVRQQDYAAAIPHFQAAAAVQPKEVRGVCSCFTSAFPHRNGCSVCSLGAGIMVVSCSKLGFYM
jgi:hypothetical protein